MKYIKKYEYLQDDPQVGDYVICNEIGGMDRNNKLDNFIKSNIGQIINIDFDDSIPYDIEYKIPIEYDEHFVSNCRIMYRDEIIHFSPNKEDLEPYINAIKYNL